MLAHNSDQIPEDYCFQILDKVNKEDTKWSIVYDVKNLTVRFKFHACETVKYFDFKTLAEEASVLGLGGNLSDCSFSGNEAIHGVAREEKRSPNPKMFFCFYPKKNKNGLETKIAKKS